MLPVAMQGYSPLLELCSNFQLSMVSNDPMHAISNVVLSYYENLRGVGFAQDKGAPATMHFEHEQGRFPTWRPDMPGPWEPGFQKLLIAAQRAYALHGG